MRLLSVLAVSGTLVLASCGSDDAKADTTTTVADGEATPTTVDDNAPTTPGAQAASAEGACKAYVGITMALASEPDGDPAAWFEDTILPMADDLDANKPAAIEGELGTMIDAVHKVADTGDMSAFEAPEFNEAKGTIDPYMFENCDFDQKIEVSGKEYAFEGLPDTIPAGRVAILFTNDGMEAHEITVASKQDGVTESFDDLLQMPEEQAMTKINMKGGAFAPQKGDQSLLIADFEPGDYAALCFVPTGTTMDDEGEHQGDGPPHFMEGMKAEFTVS
ncbi:MAG: hypothetical protein ABI239_11375 [Aquihabitans sp.]